MHNDQWVPRLVLRQQWSALNVPLMWAAAAGDSENPVLSWLADECSRGGPVCVAGVDTVGRDAVFEVARSTVGSNALLGHTVTRRFIGVDPPTGVCSAEVGRTLQRESSSH